MNPLMQISEVSVKVCFVGPPRQSIYSRCGVSLEFDERLTKQIDGDVVAVNLSFFLSLATFRMRSSACDTLARPCVRRVLCWPAFPLVPALGSTGSAADSSALFAGFPAVGSEEAPIERLASVRRTNWTCSFPASSFYEWAFAI